MTSSPVWSAEQRDECVRRGCHQSATEHRDFLREEMAEFIESGFWTVLPYDRVRHLDNLMLSPAAVKEERDRKPRLICNHSWPWQWSSVNETTVHHAPPEAMQFGGMLPRILHLARHANPKFGPARACKVDLKDGFYRLFLRAGDCPRLAILLPTYDGEPPLVAIPMACTMGWVQSPPSFSGMSETACDDANARLKSSPEAAPAHRLEALAGAFDDLSHSMVPRPREDTEHGADRKLASIPGVEALTPAPEALAPPSNMALTKPLGHTDVFVDDFILLGQGGKRRMKGMRRHLLHAIDSVLARPAADEPHRNEAASIKKLKAGDGSFATRKVILGWILDLLRQQLELPAHRKELLAQIFTDLANRKRVSYKKWQRYLGLLRFVAEAIPGSKGLFCSLQLALTKSRENRIRITKGLRHHLDTFASLAASLSHRPTHLAEIVPQEPSYLGTVDAAKAGMGGVFYDATGQPFLWRFPFPADLQKAMASVENPDGRVTNSDFEQAGAIAQAAVIAENLGARYATIHTGCDNTPAVSRMNKRSISHAGAPAFLCNFACALQRRHRYCHQVFYLPGPQNVMADDASRLQHLTDSSLLAHFEQHYPQERPWRMLPLKPETASTLISALRCNSPLSPLQLSTGEVSYPSGACGQSSAKSSASPLPSVMSQIRKRGSPTSSCSACGTDELDRPASLYDLSKWIKPFWRWARGYPTWVDSIPESKLRAPHETIPYSLLSSKASATKTHLPHESTRPTSTSSRGSQTRWTSNTKCMDPSISTSSTSPLSPSTGSSGLASTPSPKATNPEGREPSASVMCTTPTMEPRTKPQRHLCMTRTR